MATWTKTAECKVRFGDNSHKAGTEVFEKFEKAKGAKTVGKAKELGASAWKLGEWFKKGRLKVEMEMTGGDTAVDVDIARRWFRES